MNKSWIVYGPGGSGKTLHRHAIAKALALNFIIEEWEGRKETFEPHNTLHLTNELPDWAR
jgi:DNA replication protein DnaC